MAIDDPKAAFEKHYIKEKPPAANELALNIAKLAFPKAALPLGIFQNIWKRLEEPSIRERVEAMWDMLVMEVEHLESTKADVEDIQEAIQFAFTEIRRSSTITNANAT
jgi:hypothetical protein